MRWHVSVPSTPAQPRTTRIDLKLLFTDLDGTLLNKESLISQRTHGILKDFTEEGHLLIPNSGRPLLSIQKLTDSVGITDMVRYIVAYNGALVWDCVKSEPVWSACVPMDCARIIQDECTKLGIHIQTYNHETIYTRRDELEVTYYKKRIFLPVHFTDDPVGDLDEDPYKMLAIDLNDHEKLCKLRDNLAPLISDRINMVFSNDKYLEFFHKDAGKDRGIVELCKLLNVPVSDSYAAGDEQNDISMLQAAGCGIAVSNATDTVKAAADVITERDNDHDGLAEFILSSILAG